MTFNLLIDDIELLEVNGDRQHAELIQLVDLAHSADVAVDRTVDLAIKARALGDNHAARSFMMIAQRQQSTHRRYCRDLGVKLATAGYGLGVRVAIGKFVVTITRSALAKILGTLDPVPAEALAALDARLEGDTDADWSKRDDHLERMFEYSEMVKFSPN